MLAVLLAGCADQPQSPGHAAIPVAAGDQSDLTSLAKELCADNRTANYDVEGLIITRRFEGPSLTVPGLCRETLSLPGKPDKEITTVFGMFSGQFIYDPVGQYVYDTASLVRGIAPVLQGRASRSRFLIAYVGGRAEIEFQALGSDQKDPRFLTYELVNYTLRNGIGLPQPNKAFFVDYSRAEADRSSVSNPLFYGERDAGLSSKWPWKTMKLVETP